MAMARLQALEAEMRKAAAAMQLDRVAVLSREIKQITTMAQDIEGQVQALEIEMNRMVDEMDFDRAAEIRDEICKLKEQAVDAAKHVPQTDPQGRCNPYAVSLPSKKRPLAESSDEVSYEEIRAEMRKRQVVIKGLTQDTSEEDVQKAFPNAERIDFGKNKHRSGTKMCFVGFSTFDEALLASQKAEVTINEKPVRVQLYVSKEEMGAERHQRFVMVSGIPRDTTEEDVRKVFPNATKVRFGKFGIDTLHVCYVHFNTPDEALAASQRAEVTIKDKAVVVGRMVSKEELFADMHQREVIIKGVPRSTLTEDVTKLFPNATKVKFMKGKSAICFVRFPTAEEAAEVYQQRRITIRGKIVEVERNEVDETVYQRPLILKGISWTTSADDVRQFFPNAKKLSFAKSFPDAKQVLRVCYVYFSTLDEAVAASHKKSVTIGGTPVEVSLADASPNPAKHARLEA